MDIIAHVNPRYFAGIELFAATKDARLYLIGVRIEPNPDGGATLVATDGHRVAVMHDPDGWCKEPIIVGGIHRSLISACKVKGNARLRTEPGKLWIGEHGAILTHSRAGDNPPMDSFEEEVLHASKIKLVDGKYPNWRKLFDDAGAKTCDHPAPSINAAYLASIFDACSIMSPISKNAPAIRIFSTGLSSAVVVRSHDFELGDRFVAMIMPVRADDHKALLPSWMEPKKKPRVKVRDGEVVSN